MSDTTTQKITPDIKAITKGAGWQGSIKSAGLVEDNGKVANEFTKLEPNLVWLDGFEFTEGTIEFDAKGKTQPLQGSFVGIGFRVVDAETFDALFFRPFNFRADNPERKSHAVQYISIPDWPWYRLREEKTGQYEQPIDPAPDGEKWFHAKIVIKDRQISVYVNHAEEPSLQVTELTSRNGGSVGIWGYGYGLVSNLQIIPR